MLTLTHHAQHVLSYFGCWFIVTILFALFSDKTVKQYIFRVVFTLAVSISIACATGVFNQTY